MNGKTFGELLASEHKDHFYLMHLSYGLDKKERERLWKYATEGNMIGLDLPDIVKRDWVTLSESERERAGSHWINQFDLFCSEMNVGDYVVILNGTYSVLGIAKITEPKHHFRPNLSNNTNPCRFFDHVRENVKWVRQYPWDGYVLPERLTFDGTLDRVTPRTRSHRWIVLTMIDP